MKVGYARCSTDKQDLEAQITWLRGQGIDESRVYTDFGLTGTNRARPGLREALAACREGDTFTVPKLDRLARSVQDALDILQGLADKGVIFAMGGSVYDWNDPMARMFIQILAVVAEFEASLIRMRTKDGMAVAKRKGKLKGKPPKLSPAQRKHLFTLIETDEYNVSELAELFSVSRPTIYREKERAGI